MSSSSSLSSSSSSVASTDDSVLAPASAISSSSTSTSTSTISPDELAEIHKYLETVNGPAVKTIIRDREIIDCIPKDKVPFYVKVEKIPEPPKIEIRLPLGCKIVAPQRLTADCPEGTVPRRRVTLEDVLRAGSLAKFGKKSPCSALYFKRTMRGLPEGSKRD